MVLLFSGVGLWSCTLGARWNTYPSMTLFGALKLGMRQSVGFYALLAAAITALSGIQTLIRFYKMLK